MAELTLLPLDLNGNKLTHRFNGEQHTLIKIPNRRDRVIIPRHGGFYSQFLKVYNGNGTVLTRNVDYKVTYLYPDLSRLTGKQVSGMIVIVNPAVTATVTIDYRAVGSPFGLSAKELSDFFDELESLPIQIDFNDILAKPREYPAADHTHEAWQIHGWDNTLASMRRVEHAIRVGMSGVVGEELLIANGLYDEDEATLETLASQVEAHLLDFNNPHQSDRESVGLDLVNNWTVPTLEEAQGMGVGNRYMTVLRTYNALAANGLPELQNHLSDYTNPHNTKAADLGAPTTQSIRDAVADKLPLYGTAYNANLLDGRTYAQVRSAVRSNLPASSVTTGLFSAQRLGSWLEQITSNHILLGNNTWVKAQELFNRFVTPANRTYYVSVVQENDDAALSFIETTYASEEDYPVGTVVLYTMTMSYVVNGGNGSAAYAVNQLSAAIRTASGWTNMTT